MVMTMSNPTRKEVVALAAKQVGTKESPAGSNKQPYGKKYGMNGVAWCVQLAWYCVTLIATAKWVPAYIKTAYTPTLVEWAKKKGYWKGKDYLAQPGDVIVYQMPGPKRPNHIGLVALKRAGKASGVSTIEGNTGGKDPRAGGMVGYQFRSAVTIKAYLVGFVALPYAPEPKPAKPTTAAKPKVYTLKKLLKKGSSGAAVKELQKALKAAGYAPGDTDGAFGEKTKAAVKKYQKAKGLTVDGEVGKKTAVKLGWKWAG
jgi:hypothetical protein